MKRSIRFAASAGFLFSDLLMAIPGFAEASPTFEITITNLCGRSPHLSAE